MTIPRIPLLLSLLFASSLSKAQPPADSSNKIIDLDEIVISANKVPELKREVAQQIEVLTAKQILQSNPQTTADVISGSGEVMVQKSQQGGGSPIIRGFEASRVVLVIDGVRMNNIIYRAGHLQSIITIDPSIIDRAEILFGPSSTVYGSDALGGVIHIRTKNPLLSFKKDTLNSKVNAYVRFSTASLEKTAHVDLNLGGNRFGSFTSASFSDFDDLVSGKSKNPFSDYLWKREYYAEREGVDVLAQNENEFKQVFSGYSQYYFLQKFLFKQSDRVSHLLNLQLSNSSDVPRYDRLTDPGANGVGLRFAEWYYGPQFRAFASYDLDFKPRSGFFQDYSFNINYQHLEESRHQQKFGENFLQNRMEAVGVFGFDLDAHHKSKRNDLRFGMEGQVNSLTSTANQNDIVADTIATLDTRYPDGDNSMSTFAVYGTDTWKITDHWVLNGGLRFEYTTLHSTFLSTEFFNFPFDEVKQNNKSLSGNLGIICNTENNWRFSMLASTGFRSPNVDDLSRVFESEAGTIIVPNPGLMPEKTYNTDLSIGKVIAQSVKIEAVGYYTLFRDAIVLDEFQFNGEDSIAYNGILSQVLANQNKKQAALYGITGNLEADISLYFSLSASVTYTRGFATTDSSNVPLDHIPPVFGKTSFIYHHKKIKGEFFIPFSGWKRIDDYYLNGEDNEQYATPDGMPAWFTINIRGSYQLNKKFLIQLSVENILDTHYRVFASGISAPGRNFVMSLRGSF